MYHAGGIKVSESAIPERNLIIGKEFAFEEGVSVVLGKGFLIEIIK